MFCSAGLYDRRRCLFLIVMLRLVLKLQVLDKYTDVFDGKLGCYPHEKINIQLKPGAKPIQKQPYPVPYKREELFKEELKHLVREGVLRECGATQ